MRLALLILPAFLVACSSERMLVLQERQWAEADHEARGLVHDGMPVSAALPALAGAGYDCTASRDAAPRHECSRQRHLGWTLASCNQRVRFVDTAGAVAELQVPRPACTGTP